MSSMREPRKMRITAHYPDDELNLIQIQSYQLTGSWVRYFLDDGANSVTITYENDINP